MPNMNREGFAATDGRREVAYAPDPSSMVEGGVVEFELARYVRMAVKHRFLIIGATLAALVIGLAVTLLMTPVYTATSTIQIDREGARVLDKDSDVMASEALVQAEEFFQTQYGLLRSRSLAERVMDTLGLANSNDFLVQMGVEPPAETGSAADRLKIRRKIVIKVIQNNLRISPVSGSRLVKINFDSPDPQLSARVANAFAENFIQASLDRRYESTSYVRDFLEERIAQTKSKLEDAERQLVAYASQQQIINIGNEGGSGEESLASRNLGALNASLAAARSARIGAEERWRTARTTSLASLPQVLENGAVQRLNEEKARLSAEYEQKLRVYQPDYPEMRQLQARITEIDRNINEIAGSVRESIRSQYLTAVNALQAQVNGLKGDVLNLRDRSIQYNILQREVDTSRTLYDGLLQRYKEVGVAGGVTVNNVSVIDTAQPPTIPSKPNLLLNMVIAALLGIGLGVLGALLFEALDETLATPEDIEQKLGLSVLGVVPLLDKDVSPASALADIRSGFSEAYYSLRTALQFSTRNGAQRAGDQLQARRGQVDHCLRRRPEPGAGRQTRAAGRRGSAQPVPPSCA